jgi:predicted DNA binding CopG/RHH family protein
MATPRKKRTDASTWPSLSNHTSPSVHEDVVIGLIPALQEIVAWWEGRKATLEQASDASRQTERITFHVEQRWIEAIRRQADLDGFTYTQIVNEAFRQYFEGL